ncbi:MAG: SurA N-terminal domain-containing protein [Pseudomonadota bacterium]
MKGKTSNIFMFILMGLLILGLAGFGVSSFGGSNSQVASVGDAEITVTDYGRALQNQLRTAAQQSGRAVPMAEARQIGLDRQVLAQLVNTAAIDNEAASMGLSVGDERVAEQIRQIPAFAGLNGAFDREAYTFTLQSSGLTPEQFEDRVRKEAARNLLQGAVIGGLRVPEGYTDTLFSFIGARRDFTWAVLSAGDITLDIPAPSDTDLQAHHEANAAAFTLPETREITYVLLSPEMMLDEVAPNDEDLRQAYDAAASIYQRPERRLLDRLVFSSNGEAEAALAQITSGATTFDALLEARGLTLEDVDQGEVTRDDLDAEVAQGVFAFPQTGVVGPLPSPLGPALYRVNALLAAQVTSFEDAREELTAALAGDAARRAVADEIEALDDLLAGGATLEELAADTPAELGTLSLAAGSTDGIAAYPEVQEAVRTLRDGDFPEISILDDGGVFALRLDGITAPRLQPLEEIRDAVAEHWRATQIDTALMTEAEAVAERLRSGESFAAVGLSPRVEDALTREAFIDGTPPSLVTDVFSLDADGDVTLVPGNGEVYIAQLDGILPPDSEDPDAEFLQGVLSQTISQGLAEDIFTAYATALQLEAGITINQSAIEAVQAQFP